MSHKGQLKNIILSASVLMLCVICVISLVKKYEKDSPICQNGTLDLSHWDLSARGNVQLNGEWTFYPNRLLSPSDITGDPSLKSYALKVPGRWASTKSGEEMADRGAGTYRLTIQTDGHTSMYGLKVTNIRSSCRIFVNGKELLEIGKPTIRLQTAYQTRITPETVFFSSDLDRIDLTIQIANQDYYNGGILQNISLGTQKGILYNDLVAKNLDSLGLSVLLIFGFVYGMVYLFSKNNRQLLFLGLACFAYAFIRAADGEKIINTIFYWIPYMDIFRVKNAAICLSIIFIGIFVRKLGREFVPISFLRGIIFTMSLGILLVFIVPTVDIYIVEIVLNFCNTIIYMAFTILILKAFLRKQYGGIGRKGTLFLMWGMFLIVVSFIDAALYYSSIIHVYISPSFILLAVLSLATSMLVSQFKEAYDGMNALNHKLIQADQEKNELLLQTSIELKTPLHNIVNIANATAGQDYGSNISYKNLSLISSIATRLTSLVDDVLDFQSLQNNSLFLNCRDFDVSATVRAVTEVLFHMKNGEQVRLLNMVPMGQFYVHADEDRLHQILIHVVGNALKHTEKGYVKISAKAANGKIILLIEDTGTGISDEAQRNLFFKGSNESGNMGLKETSPGIGLKISKMLALRMDGDLLLQKSSPGEGTVFAVQIPSMTAAAPKSVIPVLKPLSEQPSREIRGNKSEAAGIGRYKLLIADDEATNVKTLLHIFDSASYHVLEAYSGMQALEVLNKNRDISLVLLDTAMPGMSGYEVCRRIRAQHSLYELPVLLFITRHAPQDIEEVFASGANDFLVKPYDSRELTARVNMILQMKVSTENAINMETAFLQSQIKPHFLYNALSTVISLCRKDGAKAETLLENLSSYLRGVLEIDPERSFITVRKELSQVETYLNIDKARFGERLGVVYHLDEGAMGVPIPALVIQPLVENAVRHGLMKRIAGGTVTISTQTMGMELVITVSDDGVGMDDQKRKLLLDSSISTGGVGLRNVNKRLMNAYGHMLDIQSAKDCGTKVTMRIPIIDSAEGGFGK